MSCALRTYATFDRLGSMCDAGGRDITSTAPRETTPEQASLSISVEALAWAGVILAAGVLRLADLGGTPLTVDESGRAFAAAQIAGGDIPDAWKGDLAAAATSYLFRLFGESEVTARLVPATAGAALVAVLWFGRPYVGRIGALTAGGLVAFSPLFVIYSRSATAFSLGSLVAGVIVVSLFSYLREPRLGTLFPLAFALALAPLADVVSVMAAIATVGFLALEGIFFANAQVRGAWRSFRSSPLQVLVALVVVVAGVQLGVTHFGTSLERIDLPGARLFADMFGSPGDMRPDEYFLALLLAYDWPILLAGGVGLALVAVRLARGRANLFERFLLLWTIAAGVALVLVTRREAGELLMLLLPQAMLAGILAEEIAARSDWRAASRWWPGAAVALALAGAAAMLMNEWSSGRADEAERLLLPAALVGSACLIAAMAVNARAGGASAGAGVLALLAAAFLAHSSLSVAFSDGTEFAVDLRTLGRTERLRETLDRLAGERDGSIVVDVELLDELGWALRDSPVVFGGSIESAAAVVSRPDATPTGFAGREEVWRVAEGWYPDDVAAPRRMWRWLLDREPYSASETVDVRIYVRTI